MSNSTLNKAMKYSAFKQNIIVARINNKTQYLIVSLLCSIIFIPFISGCAGVSISRDSIDTQNPHYPRLSFAKDDNFVVLISDKKDSLSSLAQAYLGDKRKSWIIADFNRINKITANREIVIPLRNLNNTGVTVRGIQSVPIISYHRFGDDQSKITVSESNFRQQMQFLKDNNFSVIPLRDIYDFLENDIPLPNKTVVITINEGYQSAYEIAYPVLRSFNFPATLFLHTDFVGSRDAISWKQAKTMYQSGLIDIQPHTKTHANITPKKPHESLAEYQKRLVDEIKVPAEQIQKQLNSEIHTFAYAYGISNATLTALLKQRNYKLAVTMQAGLNTAFSPPYMLHRTLIFGNDDINNFKKAVVTFNAQALKE